MLGRDEVGSGPMARLAMPRRSLSYEALAEMLKSRGIEESLKMLSDKIGRGSFTAGFMLQCLNAMEVEILRLAP